MGYIGKSIQTFAVKITSFQIAMRYRCLELLLTDMFKLDTQVANICSQKSISTGCIRNILPVDIRKNIYMSFIVSNFDYCAQTWHFCNYKGSISLLHSRF